MMLLKFSVVMLVDKCPGLLVYMVIDMVKYLELTC